MAKNASLAELGMDFGGPLEESHDIANENTAIVSIRSSITIKIILSFAMALSLPEPI